LGPLAHFSRVYTYRPFLILRVAMLWGAGLSDWWDGFCGLPSPFGGRRLIFLHECESVANQTVHASAKAGPLEQEDRLNRRYRRKALSRLFRDMVKLPEHTECKRLRNDDYLAWKGTQWVRLLAL
jgi:hypothetical protein